MANMIQTVKAHLLDPEYERVAFYSIMLGALVATVALCVFASHSGGAVISDGAFRWAY